MVNLNPDILGSNSGLSSAKRIQMMKTHATYCSILEVGILSCQEDVEAICASRAEEPRLNQMEKKPSKLPEFLTCFC